MQNTHTQTQQKKTKKKNCDKQKMKQKKNTKKNCNQLLLYCIVFSVIKKKTISTHIKCILWKQKKWNKQTRVIIL